MMECLILGDSIARGISNVDTRGCITKTEIGIDTRSFLIKYIKSPMITDMDYRSAVISLGTNNSNNGKILTDLRLIRKKIKADKVYWILPSEQAPQSREDVLVVAGENYDFVIEIPTKLLGPDKIHPRVSGYDYLRNALKN